MKMKDCPKIKPLIMDILSRDFVELPVKYRQLFHDDIQYHQCLSIRVYIFEIIKQINDPALVNAYKTLAASLHNFAMSGALMVFSELFYTEIGELDFYYEHTNKNKT